MARKTRKARVSQPVAKAPKRSSKKAPKRRRAKLGVLGTIVNEIAKAANKFAKNLSPSQRQRLIMMGGEIGIALARGRKK